MKTTIALEGLHFHAFHGYYLEERKMGNDFIVNVKLTVKSFDSADDNIDDTINYEEVYNICKSQMNNTQKLLETVVLNICNDIKQSFSGIAQGIVTLEKIGPQLGGRADKATVTMEF